MNSLQSFVKSACGRELECLPADARGAFFLRQLGGLLTRLGPARVGVGRQHGQGLGCEQWRLPETLEVGRTLHNISFDPTSSYLYTEIGALALSVSPLSPSPSPSPSSHVTTIANPQYPRYQGWALSADGEWITYNSEKRLWLPSEFRPRRSAVSGRTLCGGTGSGKVWVCKFKDGNPSY